MPPVTVFSLFTVHSASGFLICTYTEGPSRDRAPLLHTLSFLLRLRTFMVRNTTHTQTSVTYLLRLSQPKLPIRGFIPPV